MPDYFKIYSGVNSIRIFQVLSFVLLISFINIPMEGCSTVSVKAYQSSQADPKDTTAQKDGHYYKTVYALWWGASDIVQNVDCNDNGQSNGLSIVNVRTNWLYSLCSIVTLGAVVPLDVEYRCTSNQLQGGGVIK